LFLLRGRKPARPGVFTAQQWESIIIIIHVVITIIVTIVVVPVVVIPAVIIPWPCLRWVGHPFASTMSW
jgi:hypothetical protein